MPAGYEQVSELGGVLARASELSARTMIFDIEPLVAWWDTSQETLDHGLADIVAGLRAVPRLEVLVFATNSARRPSAVPASTGLRVIYLASAGKPLRTAPYQALPRPGVVIGDQLHTDGLLARRLGYTFLHWNPRLTGVPPGPRLMHLLGRLARPLVFRAGDPPGEHS
jgi:predicted HAD superfamily phosphohydrolase YqeG